MKIELELDYKTILRNSAQPIHLVAKLTAPVQPITQRARPTAFTVVLDRSGSMGGAPIEHAKQACREVIKNLRPDDYFSLVVFDSSAQVIIPLEQPVNRFSWYQTVDQITKKPTVDEQPATDTPKSQASNSEIVKRGLAGFVPTNDKTDR